MEFTSILEKIKPFEIATTTGHWWDSFGNSEREISARLFVRACQRVGKWAVTQAQLDDEDASGNYIFNGLTDNHLIQKDGHHFIPSPAFLTIAFGKFPAKSKTDSVEIGSVSPHKK